MRSQGAHKSCPLLPLGIALICTTTPMRRSVAHVHERWCESPLVFFPDTTAGLIRYLGIFLGAPDRVAREWHSRRPRDAARVTRSRPVRSCWPLSSTPSRWRSWPFRPVEWPFARWTSGVSDPPGSQRAGRPSQRRRIDHVEDWRRRLEKWRIGERDFSNLHLQNRFFRQK